MKKIVTLVVLVIGFISYSQILRTDNYEIYLVDYSLNEVKIAKGMYMTSNVQYFHEGTLEVDCLETGSSKSMRFFFSIWDKEYKEFLVKDLSNIIMQPEFVFENNQNIRYKNKLGEEERKEIKSFDTVEDTILNNMLTWLTVREKYNETKPLIVLKNDTTKKTIKVVDK